MRIILADDHPVVLIGIRAVIEKRREFEIVAEASNSDELIACLQAHPCDALVTDLSMPAGKHGESIALIRYIRRQYPELPIIVLTMLSNPALLKTVLDLGVRGLLDKARSIHEIGAALAAVAKQRNYISQEIKTAVEMIGQKHGKKRGHESLSPREAEVFRLIAKGMSISEIAEHVHRSYKTISQQKNDGMRKLNLHTDVELYDYARQHGLNS